MVKPINIQSQKTPPHGRFGYTRKFDIHTGFDIYCPNGEPVYAIEDGIVTKIDDFTGIGVNMPWWEDTQAISIEGKSGVILYGEIYPPNLKVGDKVNVGQIIANIKRVYRGDWEVWNLNETQPDWLLNIETILFNIYGKENLI